MRTLLVIFVSVFLAEIGDKTQLATLLYAADKAANPVLVFIAASMALISATFIAVFAGSTVTRLVPIAALKLAAGIVFIAVGIWTVATAR